MASPEQLFALLSTTLVKEFGFDEAELRPEAQLVDDLGLDSIDAIDLIVRLEEATGHRMTEEEFASVRTLNDVVGVLVDRTASSSA